jgi:membrane protein
VWNLGRDSIDGWRRHQVARTGAALAFYTVFSLAPVVILSIAIARLFFGEQAARGDIVQQIRGLIGAMGADAVQAVLVNAGRPGAGLIAILVSVVTVLIGANTALAELKTGLDQTWDVPSEKRQGFCTSSAHACCLWGSFSGLDFCCWSRSSSAPRCRPWSDSGVAKKSSPSSAAG